MSRKLNYNSVSLFHDRLFELIGEDVPRWANELKVGRTTITNRWFKGSYPGADKIQTICKKTGASSNWLLFGMGPKYAGVDDSPSRKHQELYDDLDIIVHEDIEEIVDAIGKNLRQFANASINAKESVLKDKTLNEVTQDMSNLKEEVKEIKETLARMEGYFKTQKTPPKTKVSLKA